MQGGPPPPPDRAGRFGAVILLIQLGGLLLAAAVTPSLVNGDGLGYLKASVERGGAPYPGHLGYLPLLRLVTRLVGAGDLPADRLWAGRLISLAGGVLASVALGLWARRRAGDQAGWLAAAGMWASAGALGAFADVETYGAALGALTLALALGDAPGRLASAVAAVAASAAILLHVENVLLLLPLGLCLSARRRLPVVGAAILLVGVAYAAMVAEHGPGWLVGAGHGFVQTHRWLAVVTALYGAGKSLVFAPYPYEASWPVVVGCSALGIASLMALTWCWRRPLSRAATWAWLVPYALVGLAFYGSDAERWLFVLPLLWLGVALGSRRWLAWTTTALLVAAELAILRPVARDHRARDRAEAAAPLVRDGDLIISPGHGWDEYLGFVARRRTRPFPLVYHAALHGRAQLAGAIAEAVATARNEHRRILLVRLGAAATVPEDPLGWKELAPLGITAANVRDYLPSGLQIRLGPDVEELQP